MIQRHQHVQFPEGDKNQHFALTGLNQSTDASIKPCEGGEPEAEMSFPYMEYHVTDNCIRQLQVDKEAKSDQIQKPSYT